MALTIRILFFATLFTFMFRAPDEKSHVVLVQLGSIHNEFHCYYIVFRGVFQIFNRLKNSAGSKNAEA